MRYKGLLDTAAAGLTLVAWAGASFGASRSLWNGPGQSFHGRKGVASQAAESSTTLFNVGSGYLATQD